VPLILLGLIAFLIVIVFLAGRLREKDDPRSA
jgi:hypothetical protein